MPATSCRAASLSPRRWASTCSTSSCATSARNGGTTAARSPSSSSTGTCLPCEALAAGPAAAYRRRVCPGRRDQGNARPAVRARCRDLGSRLRTGLSGPARYGWGWALALAAETSAFDDPDARRWSDALRPLADAVTGLFIDWLPKATYPVRYGLHPNTAFALSRAIPHARSLAAAGDTRLEDAIIAAATRWYGGDVGYPAAWEPSGSDFLSPVLTEAELMALLLPAGEFAAWLTP